MSAEMSNILAAMDDEALFAPSFRGTSWTAWRAFLAALFALPMDDATLALYQHHTGRQKAPEAKFKEAALICGRRGGKSRILATIAVYLAAFIDYKQHLAPGEVATVAVIAADRRQARSIFRFITGLLNGVPMLAEMVEGETAESITLANGVVIEIHTASFRVTRGYTYAAVLCDEVAFWRSDESANPDEEILAALRPGLSNIPGAMLLLASSPYAKRGALWKAFKTHFARDDSRVLVWRGTTAEMNPIIDPAIIAEAYEDDPASAAAEYGAEFRNDVGAFVPRAVVEACVVPGRYELPYASGNHYRAFLDAAGGSGQDSMTLSISHREGDMAVLDVSRERKPPFSPDEVVKEFSEIMKSYRVSRAESDKWGGDWVGEAFRNQGITVTPSAKPKSDIYREILPELNSGRVELLDIPKLIAQAIGLERRTARGGRDSIDHPPGGHDDVFNSTAGALLLASAKRGAFRISAEAIAAFSVPDVQHGAW
jgi:hypothetical protein